jgi:hypothetical protein
MENPEMTKHFLASASAAALLASAPAAAASNPLLAPWTGPYSGVPAFDQVKVEQFQPALEAAMAEQLAEIDAIAADPAAPDFDNTIAAMERAGRTLDRVGTYYGVFASTMSNPEFQAVEREMAPKLAAFGDQITQNEKLFARIAAVYAARESSGLTPEQQRLVWLYHNNFVRAGAKLDAVAKQRLSADQPEARRPLHQLRPERPRRRGGLRPRPRERGRPRRPPRLAALRRRGRRRLARPRRQVGDSQHPLVDGAVPHLLRPPRPARESLAHLLQPRRQRRRARQQRDHHRDPRAALRARPSCSATRPTRTGASRTRWRRPHSAPWS